MSNPAPPPPPPPPPGAGGIPVTRPRIPRPPSINFDLPAMEAVAVAALVGCHTYDPMKRKTTMLSAFPEMLNRLLVPPAPKGRPASTSLEAAQNHIWDNHFTEDGRKPVDGLLDALSYALLPVGLKALAKSEPHRYLLRRLFFDPSDRTWDMLFGAVPEDLSKLKAPEWAATVAPHVERMCADEINWKEHVLPTLAKAFANVPELRAASTGWSRLKPEPVLTADMVSPFKGMTSFRIRHHHNLTALPSKWPNNALKEIDLTSQAYHSGKLLSKKVQLPAAIAMVPSSTERLEGCVTDPTSPADAAEWRNLRLPKDSKLQHLGIALLTSNPGATFPHELLTNSPTSLTSLSLSKNSQDTSPGLLTGLHNIAKRITYLRMVDWYTPQPAKPLKWSAFHSLQQLHLLATEPFTGQLLPVEAYAMLPPTIRVLRATFLPQQNSDSLSKYMQHGVTKLPNLESLSLQGLDMAMGFRQDIDSAALTGKNWPQTMTRLSLGVMYIRSIGDGLASLRSLQTLELLGNKLRAIPPAIPALPNLAHLVLENNALFELPRAMAMANNLTCLRAADNRLRVVKGLPPNMKSVDLNNNFLNHLPVHADVWGAIENLTIQRNQLTSLPATLIHHIPRTANLDMRRNRFGHLAPDPVRLPEGRRQRVLSLKEAAANVALRRGISSIRASGIPGDLVDWIAVNSLKCHCGRPECAFIGLVPRYAIVKSEAFVQRSQIQGGKTTGVPVVVQFNPAHYNKKAMRTAADALAPSAWAPVEEEDIFPLPEEEVDPNILKDELRAYVALANRRVGGKDHWAEEPKPDDDADAEEDAIGGTGTFATPLPDVEDPWTLLL